MRKLIAAGNWKMNLDANEAQSLARDVTHFVQHNYQGEAHVILTPPYPFLAQIHAITKDQAQVHLAAQNMHQADKGAYTGEISATMLRSVGVSHVLIGHSERRQYFGETETLLASKVDKALAHDLTPVYCLGETLAQREAGETLAINRAQLQGGTFHLAAEQFGRLIIAYEPVWAIGTGVTASPEQAQEVHAFLRGLIAEQYGAETADNTTILYGGSVKPANAQELFGQADIDGGLVGGASLKAADFSAIIQAL